MAGYGQGAAQGLQELIAEMVLKQQLATRQRESEAMRGLQQQQIDVQKAGQTAVQGRFDTERSDAMNAQAAAVAREAERQQQIRQLRAQRVDLLASKNAPADMELAYREELENLGSKTFEPPRPEKPRNLTISTIAGGRPVTRIIPENEAVGQTFEQYREPRQGPAPDYEWVTRDGQPRQIRKGTAQPGDRPYEKGTKDTAVPNEALDTAQEAKRLAGALRTHKGVGGAFGLAQSYLPTVRQDTADAEVLRDSLRSLLTLENMGKMKGVLSDNDMKIVQQASTTLSATMSDPAAKAELTRLEAVMDKAIKALSGGGAVPQPGGETPDQRRQRLLDAARKAAGGR